MDFESCSSLTQSLTQPRYICLQCVVRGVLLGSVCSAHHCIAGNHVVDGSHQHFEDRELAPRCIFQMPGNAQSSSHSIQFHIGDGQELAKRSARTPQHRSNTRRQFAQLEWLGDIIIGAGIQALNPIFNSATGG